MNLLALGLVTWLFTDGLGNRGWAGAMLVSALAIGLGLLWAYPDVGWYVGLSGVLHGLVVVGALDWLRRGDRAGGFVLLAAVAAKLVYEALLGPLPGSASTAGGPVLVEAHQLGALGGVGFAAGGRAAAWWRQLYSAR
jgi:rhomboid family GlyGly-CTERM serine protease